MTTVTKTPPTSPSVTPAVPPDKSEAPAPRTPAVRAPSAAPIAEEVAPQDQLELTPEKRERAQFLAKLPPVTPVAPAVGSTHVESTVRVDNRGGPDLGRRANELPTWQGAQSKLDTDLRIKHQAQLSADRRNGLDGDARRSEDVLRFFNDRQRGGDQRKLLEDFVRDRGGAETFRLPNGPLTQQPRDVLADRRVILNNKDCMRCHPDPNRDRYKPLPRFDPPAPRATDADIAAHLRGQFERSAKDLSPSDRAGFADAYARRLSAGDPRAPDAGRRFADQLRLDEAALLRRTGGAENQQRANELIARTATPEQRTVLDALKAAKPQEISYRDGGDALRLLDELKPADQANYAANTNIRRGDEAHFLSDREVNRLFDSRVWMNNGEAFINRDAIMRMNNKDCIRCHPSRETPKLDPSFFGREPYSMKAAVQPKIDTPEKAAEHYLTQRDARFSGDRTKWDPATQTAFTAERSRLLSEDRQRAEISARPDDPTARFRHDKSKLTPEQRKVFDDHARLYEVRSLEQKIRPGFDRLDAEYKANNWAPDSQWYGVDNAAFMQDLAKRATDDPSKISRYDGWRGLNASEDYRKQNPEVFAARPDGFAASRAGGNELYYRNIDEMRAARVDDLAAREAAIKADPNSPIAYLKKPMSELSGPALDTVTQDYSRYGIERLEQTMRSQTVAGVGREVDRLDKHFDRMLREQGVVGDTANWLKNNIGSDGGWIVDSRLGSNAVTNTIGKAYAAKQAVLELQNFKGSPEEFRKAYETRVGALQDSLRGVDQHMREFQKSQENWVEGIADVGSTIAAVGAVAAAPVTGGASLLVGAAVGASAKVGIKGLDAMTGSGEYQGNVLMDLGTGGVNGLTGVGSGMAARKASETLLKNATAKLAAGETLPMLTRAGIFTSTRMGVGAADGFVSQTANGTIRGEKDPLAHGLRGAAFGAVLFPLGEGASAGLGKLWKAARGVEAPVPGGQVAARTAGEAVDPKIAAKVDGVLSEELTRARSALESGNKASFDDVSARLQREGVSRETADRLVTQARADLIDRVGSAKLLETQGAASKPLTQAEISDQLRLTAERAGLSPAASRELGEQLSSRAGFSDWVRSRLPQSQWTPEMHRENFLARTNSNAATELGGLSPQQLRAIYPEGGALPTALGEIGQVKGFAELAKASPADARRLADASATFGGVRTHAESYVKHELAAAQRAANRPLTAAEISAAEVRGLQAAASYYQPMLPKVSAHPTDARYMVVERGPNSPDWMPEVNLRPRAELDHNGAFMQRGKIPGAFGGDNYVKTGAVDTDVMRPSQLVINGKPMTDMNGVMVFSGHGGTRGFSGLNTQEAAKMAADQIVASARAGTPVDKVVLDACNQRNARWFFGGSNAEAFQRELNQNLAAAGVKQPVTVLAASRGGPTYGASQRDYLPSVQRDPQTGKLSFGYQFKDAAYTPAADGSKLYLGKLEAAIGAAVVLEGVGGYYIYRNLSEKK